MIIAGIFGMVTTQSVQAQLNLGLDVMSRYVWRGADFGNSPSIQPDISFTSGNLTIGGWAAMATNGNPAGSEIDFYLSYDIGNFSLSVTDYTFPEDAVSDYFAKSSHFVEIGLGWAGTSSFPLSISTGMFVTNDDDYSIYTELGYSVENVDLMLGFTPSASALYGTSKAGIIHTGISAYRDIQVTEAFSFKLTGSLIVNPYSNNAFFLVGVGF